MDATRVAKFDLALRLKKMSLAALNSGSPWEVFFFSYKAEQRENENFNSHQALHPGPLHRGQMSDEVCKCADVTSEIQCKTRCRDFWTIIDTTKTVLHIVTTVQLLFEKC